MFKFNFFQDSAKQGAKSPFYFAFVNNPRGQVNVLTYLLLLFFAILIAVTLKDMSAQTYLVIVVAWVIFLVSFFNTGIALAILIFSMLLSPEISQGATEGRQIGIRAEDIFLLVIFLGWLAKMAINKEFGFLRANPLNTPITIYILICLVSSFLAIMQQRVNPKASFFFNLKYIEYFLLFFMVGNNLKNEKQIRRFVFFLLFTCLIVCFYAWSRIPSGERLSSPFQPKAGGGEPNTLSGYLLLIMGVTAGLALYTSSAKKRLLLLLLFAFSLVPFIYTLSRGGWIAFFPMIITLILLTKRFKTQTVAIFLIGIIILVLVPPRLIRDRIEETFAPEKSYQIFGKEVRMSESAGARLESWSVAFQKYNKHPILGVGIPGVTVIDNQYTRVLIETGALGTLVFLWLLFMIYRLSASTLIITRGNNFAQGLTVGFLAGFVGLLTHAFSAATFIIVRIMEPFWFLAAIVIMLPDVIKEEEAQNLK